MAVHPIKAYLCTYFYYIQELTGKLVDKFCCFQHVFFPQLSFGGSQNVVKVSGGSTNSGTNKQSIVDR